MDFSHASLIFSIIGLAVALSVSVLATMRHG